MINQTAETPALTEVPSRDKISREPICCTIENCTKTFRKQSLLDYHLKYHHHVSDSTPLSSVSATPSTATAVAAAAVATATPLSLSTSTSEVAQPATKKRRLSSSLNEKSSSLVKRSFLKMTSLGSSLNASKSAAGGLDDNAGYVDADDADDVFISDLVGLSDSNEAGRSTGDPYEVIHCKCGTHSSVGFMIQVHFSTTTTTKIQSSSH